MNCPKCGVELLKVKKFCFSCGASLQEETKSDSEEGFLFKSIYSGNNLSDSKESGKGDISKLDCLTTHMYQDPSERTKVDSSIFKMDDENEKEKADDEEIKPKKPSFEYGTTYTTSSTVGMDNEELRRRKIATSYGNRPVKLHRVFALLIDMVILGAIFAAVSLFAIVIFSNTDFDIVELLNIFSNGIFEYGKFSSLSSETALAYIICLLIFHIIIILYYASFESSNLQATPGKLIFKYEVIRLNGCKAGFFRAFIKAILRIVFVQSCLLFFFALALFALDFVLLVISMKFMEMSKVFINLIVRPYLYPGMLLFILYMSTSYGRGIHEVFTGTRIIKRFD